MVPAFQLQEIVRDARARTGVPGVAAAAFVDGQVVSAADGVRELGRDEPVLAETPFRVASISKPFTASLAVALLEPDAQLKAWLSHTSGLRCERAEPLPEGAHGLFSYSNAGYWAAGAACEAASGLSFSEAMGAHILEPLGLASTGYDEPPAPARGHVQHRKTGHRAVPTDAYPVARRPSGGLWSTAGDLLTFAAHHLGGPGPLGDEARAALREPQSHALGGGYGLGWWTYDAGGRAAIAHEGSVAGYQSLLLLVPEERFALAVLTNSWRGSGLVRRVVEALGVAASAPAPSPDGVRPQDVAGTYALDTSEARVDVSRGRLFVAEGETDPITGTRQASGRLQARELGGGVFGFAGGALMSHRFDFPRPGLARIGWVVLPRVRS